MAKNEVIKKEDALPVAAGAYAEYAGRGLQNVTQEDVTIPFVNILQKGSPQVDPDSEMRMENAKAGMFHNSVTNELFETIRFVPAITQHTFVEWVPRNQGGGIVGRHELGSDIVRVAKAESTKFGKYKTKSGNDLVETYYMFGVLLNENGESRGPALLAFTSTKIKAYRRIMGRLNSFQITLEDGSRITPPLFAHELRLSTLRDENSLGTFYVPVIEPAVGNDVMKSLLATNDPRFLLGAEIEKLVSEGRAKADESTQGGATASSDADEDLPF